MRMKELIQWINTKDASMIESLYTCYHCIQYLSWEVCGCELAVTGTVECNKSPRKLASSRCTLIHSLWLCLCALFSLSPNTVTLNLHTQIHRESMHGCTLGCSWQNTSWRTHSQAHRDKMRARCIDSYWIMDNTHTRVLPRGLEAQRVADIWRFSTWSSS